MTYELVIKESQPTCGGKSPTKTSIHSVSCDDPLAYVKGLEPDSELVTETQGDTLIITANHNGMPIKYEFTED